MKSRLIKTISSGIAVAAFWLASWGSAQAGGPVCAPTYSIALMNGTDTMVLEANCTPDPLNLIDAMTGYSWTKNGSSVTGVTGGSGNGTSEYSEPVTGANGQTYGLVATETYNGVSTSNNIAPVTVNVTLPYYPTCSLATSVSPTTYTANIPTGGSVTLVPSCQNVYPNNSLNWYSAPGNGIYSPLPNPAGGIVSPTATTTTYFVVGANDYGDSASNIVTVTTAVAPPPLSACTFISPASQSVTLGSGSSSLSATCSNSPTAWVWKLNGSPIGGCGTGSSTCTIPSTSLTSTSSPYAVTVTANNAGGTGITAASATITVTGSTSGAPAGCTIQNVNWPSGFSLGVNPKITMNNGQAYAFQISNFPARGTVSVGTIYANAHLYASISTSPCNFSQSLETSFCAGTSTVNDPTIWTNSLTTTRRVCNMTAGQTYYLNLKNASSATGPDTCPVGMSCTFYPIW